MENWNKPETEQDAELVQARRRYLALRSLKAQQGQTPASSPSQSNTPATMASTSSAKPNTSK